MPRIIEVTFHALEQWIERWETSLEREELRMYIAEEVNEALVEGRYSSKMPRFALKPGRNFRSLNRNGSTERDRTLRVAWTADSTRCYLLDKRGNSVRVVTSIKPSEGDSHSA